TVHPTIPKNSDLPFKPFGVMPIVIVPLRNEFTIRSRNGCVAKITEKVNVGDVNMESPPGQRPVKSFVGHDQELPIGVRLPIETGQSAFRPKRARRARNHQARDKPSHGSNQSFGCLARGLPAGQPSRRTCTSNLGSWECLTSTCDAAR